MASFFTFKNCVHKVAMKIVALSVHYDLLLSYVSPLDGGIGVAQSPRAFSNACFGRLLLFHQTQNSVTLDWALKRLAM